MKKLCCEHVCDETYFSCNHCLVFVVQFVVLEIVPTISVRISEVHSFCKEEGPTEYRNIRNLFEDGGALDKISFFVLRLSFSLCLVLQKY